MASHESRRNTAHVSHGASTLDGVVPFDTEDAAPMSWELGDRLTRQGDANRVATFENPARNTSLAVFEATTHTRLVRVRTPVGREKFYGVARRDVDVDGLREREGWRETHAP